MRRTEGHGIVRKDRKMISPAAAAAGLSALCLLVLLSLRYRFWFDLNDDVLMKDILSGVYTGTPESRNIQMLYPVSALIAVLYRIIAFIPKTLYTLNRGGVYGSFLILCQAGSAGIFSYCLTEQAFETRSLPRRRRSGSSTPCSPATTPNSPRAGGAS